MTNNNSHQIFGINYFREKAIAATVVLAAVLVTIWLTDRYDKKGLADRDNDGVLDNVDKSPDEKGELKYEGGIIGKDQEDKTAKQSKDSEKQTHSPSESETSQPSSNEPNPSANQGNIGPPTKEVPANLKPVPTAKAVRPDLKFDDSTNKFTWNEALIKCTDLKLIITAPGQRIPETIPVTGKSEYRYSPGEGSKQGMKITAVLTSTDARYTIQTETSETYSPNCSAD
jgi:hypothetical protein